MNRVYIIADLHGDFKPIRNLYTFLNSYFNKDMKPDSSDTVILLGDAGLNYYFNNRDNRFKEALGKYKFTYFVIRGNHEERPSICAQASPDKWHEEGYFGGKVLIENDYPYIKYAADEVSVYSMLGKRTLVVPGAYSVDKEYRLQNGWSWFPHEQLSEEEMEAGKRLIELDRRFDLVLSHTCPFSIMPTDLFLSCVNQDLVDKTTERYLEWVEKTIEYDLWCWGHYHDYRVYPGETRQMLMLFNKQILDYTKYLETKNILNSIINLSPKEPWNIMK